MPWFVIGCALALLLYIALRVWRRWIEPWGEIDELVRDIAEGKPPRKFLMTGNARAHRIGLSLENLVTRLTELDRAAQEGTLSLQTILGALPDGLVVVDEGGRMQLMNAEFQRVFGDGLEGTTLFAAVRDAAVERLLTTALREGDVRREMIQKSTGAPDGQRLELEVNVVPFSKNPRGMSGAVVLFRDLTQVRRVEEMRRDFVANVSHELRTPLSIFRGYLETLLDDPRQPPGELVRILEVMERHSERLTNLVDDILSLARLEAPEAQLDLAELDLRQFLAEVMRDWEKRFAAKELHGEVDLANDLPSLTADEARLQEVIYNLLDNAVKYSPVGGVITVRAVSANESVRISVSDAGRGIATRDLPRIFERFYRADKARSRELGGTGLGLSIVKHIAQLHGGSATAESEIGRGTTITVSLPLERKAAPAPAAAVTESSH